MQAFLRGRLFLCTSDLRFSAHLILQLGMGALIVYSKTFKLESLHSPWSCLFHRRMLTHMVSLLMNGIELGENLLKETRQTFAKRIRKILKRVVDELGLRD